MDEDQSTKKFFGGATKNKSENMDEDQSTKHFLEGHFKTIGKWVQKRQTLIFTVANFSVCQNEEVNFDFDGKTRRIFKQPPRPRAGPPQWPLHALCVFSRRPLFDSP